MLEQNKQILSDHISLLVERIIWMLHLLAIIIVLPLDILIIQVERGSEGKYFMLFSITYGLILFFATTFLLLIFVIAFEFIINYFSKTPYARLSQYNLKKYLISLMATLVIIIINGDYLFMLGIIVEFILEIF